MPNLAVHRVLAQSTQSFELFLEVLGAGSVAVTVKKPGDPTFYTRYGVVDKNTNVFNNRDWVADTDDADHIGEADSMTVLDLENSTLYELTFVYTFAGSGATETSTYYYINCKETDLVELGFFCAGGGSGHNDLVFLSDGGKVEAFDDRTEGILDESFDDFFGNQDWVIPHYLYEYCESITGCEIHTESNHTAGYFLGSQPGESFNLPSFSMNVPINRNRSEPINKTWTLGNVTLNFAPGYGINVRGADNGDETTVNATNVTFVQAQAFVVHENATLDATDVHFSGGHLKVKNGGTALLHNSILGNTKFTVKTGASVTMSDNPGEEIRLGSQFKAESGSTFRAYIKDSSDRVQVSEAPGVSVDQIIGEQATLGTDVQTRTGETSVSQSLHEVIGGVPDAFGLAQNYPNPFNPITTITYALKEDTHVTLEVYNILGQHIATLVDGFQQAGYRSVVWNGRNNAGVPVPSGTYLYRIIAGDFVQAQSMNLLK